MNLTELQCEAAAFLSRCPANFISADDALRKELAGLQIYDAPLFGSAAADDPLFETLRRPGVVHPDMLRPADWLTGARSVLSFFLPFTEQVRRSNAADRCAASDEWLHARIEGQLMLNQFGGHLCALLKADSAAAVFPTTDPRFRLLSPYVSNWSERHVAWVCGLGTFGLSRGLITERGMAGRFGSIVTTASLPAARRRYTGPFDFCILCG